MEVILKEDVANLGHRGDVVKVADGYGRNFLLPRKLALQATVANKAVIDQMPCNPGGTRRSITLPEQEKRRPPTRSGVGVPTMLRSWLRATRRLASIRSRFLVLRIHRTSRVQGAIILTGPIVQSTIARLCAGA